MTTPGTPSAQAGATNSKPATITTWNNFAENMQPSFFNRALYSAPYRNNYLVWTASPYKNKDAKTQTFRCLGLVH